MLACTGVVDARPQSDVSRSEIANLPGGAFFEGQWQSADMTVDVRDPEDGFLLGQVCTSTSQDVRRAIAHIHRDLQLTPWPLRARRQALEKATRLLDEQSARFANIIAAESSKTIAEAEREVSRCIETLRLSAAASSELSGSTLDLDDSTAAGNKIGANGTPAFGQPSCSLPMNASRLSSVDQSA